MKKRKTMITLLLAAALSAASLTGCGNNTQEAENSSASSAAETPVQSADGFLYEENDDKTVTVMGLDPDAEDPGDTITIQDTIDGMQVTAIGEKAFQGNLNIRTVTLPDTVTSIGAHAFDDCSNLSSIHLPDALEIIGEGAFFCCGSLPDLDFPSGLTTIGKGAFYNCQALTKLTMPESLTDLENYAFYSCKGLTDVTLNEGLTEISPQAFMNCESLETVTLPSTLTVIDEHAFDCCMALVSVSLPENLTTIGAFAFNGCSLLNHVEVTAKEVGSNAFYGCSELTDLILGAGVEKLGDECLSYTGLTSLKIPASVRDIGSSFVSCDAIDSFETEEDGNFTAVDGVLFSKDMKTLIAYPSAKQGESYAVPDGVTAIAASAFAESGLTSISLPEGLISIGEKAFYAVKLKKMEIPDTVETLGESVFKDCTELRSVKLSDAITELPRGLFDGDDTLEDITYPSGLTTISAEVFAGCPCTTLTIPDSVTEVEPRADLNSSITAFAVSDSNQNFSVKEGVLFSKDGKKLVNYPYAKTDVKDYIVPEGTESIGRLAFCGVQGMNSVTLADSIVTLDEESLVDIPAVTVDEALTDIGENALGYAYYTETEETSPEDGFVIYGVTGSKAEAYADEQGMAFATGKMKLSAEKMTIQVGETRTLSLENADTDQLYFFSSDESILTVDEKGVITPVANGTTSVIAAIGTKYYMCRVTVEGGSEPEKNEELSGYTMLNKDTYKDWEKAYEEKNAGVSFETKDNSNITLYTGDAYIPIVTAQEGEEYSHYKDGMAYPDISLYEMVGEDLNIELSRYTLQADTEVFSGKNAHEIGNYTGTGATLKDLVDSVGKTFTRNEVISTSISYNVASGFGNYILYIYAPADVTRGMYCSSISEYNDEYELLLAGDTTYKIIGAGVREMKVESFGENDNESYEEAMDYDTDPGLEEDADSSGESDVDAAGEEEADAAEDTEEEENSNCIYNEDGSFSVIKPYLELQIIE